MQTGAEIIKAAKQMSGDAGRPAADKEIAESYRARLIEAHKPVFAILDEARAAGFEINLSSGPGPGPDGKIAVQSVRVMKVL